MCQGLARLEAGASGARDWEEASTTQSGKGDGGRPVCSQPSPVLPTSLKGGSWQEEGGRDPGVQPRASWNLDLHRERNLPWDGAHSSKYIVSSLGRRRPSTGVMWVPSSVGRGATLVLPGGSFSHSVPLFFLGGLWDAETVLSVCTKPRRLSPPLKTLNLILSPKI